jgi:hypothetical protein
MLEILIKLTYLSKVELRSAERNTTEWNREEETLV